MSSQRLSGERRRAVEVVVHRLQRSAGFTLLEVLLALGLSVVLLVALSTALDLFRRFSPAGRADIEQAQLARAILQKMAADIRCVVPPPKSGASASSDSTSGASSSSSSSSTTGGSSSSTTGGGDPEATTIEVVDPTAAYAKEIVGVLGDSQTLILTICRPTRSLGSAPGVANSLTQSDMKSVSYFLAQEGAEGLRGLVDAPAVDGSVRQPIADGVRGLARLEGDRLAIARADAVSDLETLAQRAKLLAPEVHDLQFRYCDGLDWFDNWDGTTSGLPRAVEITIGFLVSDEAATRDRSTDDLSTATELYRLVVAIPSSAPLTSTEGI